MASSTITWVVSWCLPILQGLPLLDTPIVKDGLSRTFIGLVALLLLLLAAFWERQVTRIVPQPYLDEVFHIPQAQAYCLGRYRQWDPKLTTPAGLYIFTTAWTKIWPGSYIAAKCSDTVLPHILRYFNCLALVMVMFYACSSRAMITRTWNRSPNWNVELWKKAREPLNSDALHTALNIALFPPLFFFSGVFYTDVLSTCVVIRTYRMFLGQGKEHNNSSVISGISIYLLGMLALTMRQTNIFWVAVFLGGLEVVRSISSGQANEKAQPRNSWQTLIKSSLAEYNSGKLHDCQLNSAGVHDFILCVISIAVAAVSRPALVITKLWPYIALLASFAGFIYWNGGVVLGDKSNHVATLHLPQMLYVWPFISFFSAPLVIPAGISFLRNLVKLLSIPLFPRLVWKYVLVAAYMGAALAATLVIIKYNTIIHPFTLADNRHYMFYVFRYTILRHPLIRFLLAPIYLACAYLVYLTLCAQPSQSHMPRLKSKKESTGQSDKLEAIALEKAEGPTTSFTIILLVTTALSLITAPLVEPRYFIIPWVIWRLNVPSLIPSSPATGSISQQRKQIKNKTLQEQLRYWSWEGHDYRLWIETCWFLLINAITGYIFLYRGFKWPQEPGNIQRFMW